MSIGLDNLKAMEYPGRIIIIGRSPAGLPAVMYAITGRSPSSQARKLEVDQPRQMIFVKPTDEEILKTGNPDLLVYPAIICGRCVAVSNGKQTADVFQHLTPRARPAEALLKALRAWQYEPDEPNYTPRISGGLTAAGAGLSLLKRAADGSVMRSAFEIPLLPGAGKMVATYTGANANPLPPFAGEPQDVALPWSHAADAAAGLYEALAPRAGGPDLRVAAAAAFAAKDGTFSLHVKNRHA